MTSALVDTLIAGTLAGLVGVLFWLTFHDHHIHVAVEDRSEEPREDCWARCFVNYAGKRYDRVCPDHFDEIGRELSRG